MGMFDSFYCDKLMPDGFQMKYPDGEAVPEDFRNIDHGALYQTKCMDCELDIYTLTPEDQLVVQRSKNRGVTEVCDYTGTIEIYTGIGEHDKTPNKYFANIPTPIPPALEWRGVEYELTFVKGMLASINYYYSV